MEPDEAGDASEANVQRYCLLSIIRGLAPRNAVERMLAVPMAATYVAAIRSARHLATCSNLPQHEAHYTGYTKLTRSFAAQVEELRKHRTGGRLMVLVQHFTVAEGGHAIMGHVETGGSTRGVGT